MKRVLLGGLATLLLTLSIAAGAQAQQGFEGGYTADGVNIRTDPFLSATVIGLGYTPHRACLHFFDTGDTVNGSPRWWHHFNMTTGVGPGWSHESYLFTWNPHIDCFQ